MSLSGLGTKLRLENFAERRNEGTVVPNCHLLPRLLTQTGELFGRVELAGLSNSNGNTPAYSLIRPLVLGWIALLARDLNLGASRTAFLIQPIFLYAGLPLNVKAVFLGRTPAVTCGGSAPFYVSTSCEKP